MCVMLQLQADVWGYPIGPSSLGSSNIPTGKNPFIN